MKINTKNTILGTIFAGLLLFSGSNVFAAATPDIPAIITPAVITNSATSITTTSAILNGTVNPNGASTTAWFEDNNGNTFGLINVGSGNNAVTMLPYHWTGLTPNTNYIFRAVAQNVNGTATGSWGHFTTNQNPNNSTTPTLNSISPANATLGQTLSVTLDGTGFIANSTVVFSASGIVVNSTTINSTTSITVNISINSNASVGSNNVVVNNNNGTSNIQTFTIINSGGGGGGALVPSISSISPSSVLVGSGATTINIYGSNFTNNSLIYFNNSTRSVNFVNSGQITMYLNYSDTSSVGSWNIYVANNSGNNSNYITFTVYSSGGGGGGGGGGGRPIYHVGITTQNATDITKNSVTLSGTINPNNQSTTGWFEYGTTYDLTTFNETTHLYFGSTGYYSPLSQNINNLYPNTTYYFRAVGNNSDGTIRGTILSFTTKNSISNIINNFINGDEEPTNVVYQNDNTSDTIDTTNNNPTIDTTTNQNSSDSNYFNNNNQGANALFGFTSFLPNTFLGWLTLLVLILLFLIIARNLYADYSYQKSRNKVSANHIDNLPV